MLAAALVLFGNAEKFDDAPETLTEDDLRALTSDLPAAA